jgi:hypothetical protein
LIIETRITNLREMVEALPLKKRERFDRIFTVSTETGELRLPPGLEPWVQKQFGSIEPVLHQKIVRLTNRVTGEESFFNGLRRSRPADGPAPDSLQDELAKASQNDIFRSPLEDTAEDVFGRVKGKFCVTASNVAKNDAFHGVVIFNDLNPLDFTLDKVIDYIDTGMEWGYQMQRSKPDARYFLFFWNCLWRAGASQSHGHAQVLLTTGSHYTKIERLRLDALKYRQKYNSNYFEDLFDVHRSLGCAIEKDGIRILSCLTPQKYNEVMIISEALDLQFKVRIYDMLALFRDKLNVTSFNFGMLTPPLAQTEESWEGFPFIARIMDRGGYDSRMSDVGGFEIFGASMVISDPMKLFSQMEQYLADR